MILTDAINMKHNPYNKQQTLTIRSFTHLLKPTPHMLSINFFCKQVALE